MICNMGLFEMIPLFCELNFIMMIVFVYLFLVHVVSSWPNFFVHYFKCKKKVKVCSPTAKANFGDIELYYLQHRVKICFWYFKRS